MEVNQSALRSRVLYAVLLIVGLVVGAQTIRFSKEESGTQKSPSGEAHASPGGAAVLRQLAPSGKSQAAAVVAVSAAAGVVADPDSLKTRWKQSSARLKYLDHCAHEDCAGFDQSKAWTYDINVHRETAREIGDFAALAVEWRDDHGVFPAEASGVAQYFLQTGNDDVKEAALKLMDLAPVTADRMRASIGAVQTSASGPLMKVFLKSHMIESCAESNYASMCVHFIARAMEKGGANVQQTLARYSLQITNEKTAPILEQIEARQDPRSLTREYLRLNREEWRRFQRGG